MENHDFKYLSVAHSEAGCGYVAITLEREEGVFNVVLTADDAARLLRDLPEQVRIAAWKSK